jgi:hypothetical protein
MILGGTERADGTRATFDDFFRRAGVRHTDAPALIDPPNCTALTGLPPRKLSYAQADRAISAIAARLRGLGLQTDTVVAMQLANTVDSVIALLGVLRAGMIAAPLPLLWREQEMVEALGRIGAKAIITSAKIGAHAQADIAMQVAAEMFPIRYICGFGRDLPDGVVPLDDCFTSGAGEFFQPSPRPGQAAAHVAVVTFDVTGDGLVPVARSQSELIAGGLAAFLEGGIAQDVTILSAIPLGSFAGLALTLVPWLLAGGTLALHHGFDTAVFAAQSRTHAPGVVVVPGPALTPLAEADLLGGSIKRILALWRAPEQLAAAAPWQGDAALIDVPAFGEVGLLPGLRGSDGVPVPYPHGAIAAPRGVPGARAAGQTKRGKAGTLALRGPMVPVQAFPPGGEQGDEASFAPDGFRDTGFACRVERDTTLVLTAPPAGIAAVGYYRFRQSEIDAAVAEADPAAVVVALPDAQLGQRLAGSAREPASIAAELKARGVNALIAGAFRPRGKAA